MKHSLKRILNKLINQLKVIKNLVYSFFWSELDIHLSLMIEIIFF